MFYISQLNHDDCGFASLKTLLANLFKDEKYLYLHQDEEHGVYSYQQLIEIASKYGVNLSGVKIEAGELRPFHSLPSLVAIKGGGNYLHLVYLKKISKHSVIVFDPERGVRHIPKKEFMAIWDRTALVVDSYEEKEVKISKYDVSPGQRIINLLLNFLGAASIILGLMFVDKKELLIVSLVLFSLYIILEIINRAYISYLMKKIDNNCLEDIKEKPNNPRLFLLNLANFKKSLFLTPSNFFLNIIVIVFLAIIMGLNNVYNNIITLSAILIMLLDIFFINPYLKNRERKVAKLELFKDCDSPQDFKDNFKLINEESYKLAMIRNALFLITRFLLCGVVILVMIICNITSVPFIFVYFGFALILVDRLEQIINFPNEVEEVKKHRARLNNCIKNEDDFF